MILRPYQNSGVERVFVEWETHQSTLGVLYTGGGKTVMFADIIKRMQPKRALVIAHREELIWQARHKIGQVAGLDCEVEMADLTARADLFHRSPVVVSTIQTQVSGSVRKRMHRFKPTDFGLLIIDEAHHATADSYREVIAYYSQNPNLKILGVTATPDRTDQEALGQIFKSVAFDYEILDGIDDGWLCDITQQFVPVAGLDYSHIKTTAGDLNNGQLKMVMEAEANIMGVCQPSMEVLYGLPPHSLDTVPVPEWGKFLGTLGRQARRAIVFTASVAQAEACCNIFNRVLPGMAKWVSGKTNKDERRDTLLSFKEGNTRVVMNCGVLTEGFDDPGVEVIIMARPTKSRSLYAQMVGRATRALPGVVDGPGLDTAEKRKAAIAASPKPYCRIIDFVGNSGRHKLITCMDVLGGNVTEKAKFAAIEKAQREGKPVRVSRALTNAEIDLQQAERKRALDARAQEEARRAALIAKSKFSQHDINPFGRESGPTLSGGWRPKRILSEKQRRLLLRNGFNPSNMTYADGCRKIGELIEKWKKQKESHGTQTHLIR